MPFDDFSGLQKLTLNLSKHFVFLTCNSLKTRKSDCNLAAKCKIKFCNAMTDVKICVVLKFREVLFSAIYGTNMAALEMAQNISAKMTF